MPTLEAEPQLYPANLFAEGVRADGRAWWVMHTRPRQEKCLARSLHAAGVPFFLPLIASQKRTRKWLSPAHLPLFPGYLFLRGNHQERLIALSSARIVQSLEVVDQDGLERDLAQVHRLIESGAPLAAEERLEPGAPVMIQSGPLAGLRGKIVQEASRRRFVVAVDFIQRGVSVLLDGSSLLPILG